MNVQHPVEPRMALGFVDRPPYGTYHVIVSPSYVAACDNRMELDSTSEASVATARSWNPCHRKACRNRWDAA
jgi:hypothetical protein